MTVDIAGVVIRRVRLSTLPPGVSETHITNAMSTYGEVNKIHCDV